MSGSGNVRSTAHNDRKTSATASTRPRVPPSRDNGREPNDLRGEVIPQDSVSNVPSRRNLSGSHGLSGSGSGPKQRRTEKAQISTTDHIHIQARKLEKAARGNIENEQLFQEREPDRTYAPAAKAHAAPSTKLKEINPPWNPQVSLVPHTTAPLASRISFPPLASRLPAALEPEPLQQLTPDAQESAILEDLIFVFMGYEGQYIRFQRSYNPSVEKDRLIGPLFQTPPGLDTTLRDLITPILKLATHFSAVGAFIEVQSREEFGAVNHALCASIRKLLKDHYTLVAQLEHQSLTNPNFTIHVLSLHILPSSRTLSHLYAVVQEIQQKNSLLEEGLEDSIEDFYSPENIMAQLSEAGMSKKICKGGNVLRLLTERLSLMSGDPAARKLLQTLLRDSSRPYMNMLNEWLHHGAIKDPHAEFLIKEQKSIKRERLEEDYTDEYWEKRYTVRDADVPPQLESVKEKVLLAGKYLNVMRECGRVDISKEVKEVPPSFDDPQFLDNVNNAYAYANSSLLNLLLTTHALPARLRSLKHYFFLDRSDFFSYFLDLSASELKKPARGVNVSKLQSLLDLVLRQPGTVAAQDSFKEDVKVQMNEVGLTKWLMRVVSVSGIDQDAPEGSMEKYQTPAVQPAAEEDKNIVGFDAMELDYSVPFPLSLVISRKTVLRYQLLFRYLLSLRHLEGLIVSSWEDHNKILSWRHRSSSPRIEIWKRRAWTLRARMLVFVQQLMYFCTAEVIEPNFQVLMARVNGNSDSAKDARNIPRQVNRTVDELMQDHVDFLDTCLKECMLTNSKLLKIHAKLMSVCQLFATYTGSLSRSLFAADSDLAGSKAAEAYLMSQSTSKNPVPDNLRAYDSSRLTKMEDTLQKYEDNFNRHLRLLLHALDYYAATETVALSRLCAQLSTASESASERSVDASFSGTLG